MTCRVGFVLGGCFVCVFSPIRNDPTKNTYSFFFPPTLSADNHPNLFIFMWFSFPEFRKEGFRGTLYRRRLRIPGFGNRNFGFGNHPKLPKYPPATVWECTGVHCALGEICMGQVLGWDGGRFADGGDGNLWQPGLRNLKLRSLRQSFNADLQNSRTKKTPFQTFLGFRTRKAGDSCKWSLGSQIFSTSPYNPINVAGSHESSRTTSEPSGSYELSWLLPLKQGREAESSYEPGGSDVVRELSREPAMFQIGL